MTFYHHVEELMHANWRFHKEFIGKYEDFNNVIAEIKTKIFVRKLEENVKTDVIGMEKILWSKNIYSAQHNNSHKSVIFLNLKLT